MRRSILFSLTVIIAFSLAAQQNTTPVIKLNTAVDSACYAIGVLNGTGLREQMKTFPGGGANLNVLAAAFSQAMTGDQETLLISQNEAQTFLQAYLMAATVKEADEAKETEERFFAANKTKEGVITTESGLQYKVLKKGNGDMPAATDKVTVHYTGRLLDGTVFDSSEERGEPMTFEVTRVIRGWGEVLQLMPLGSRYQTWIPAELAYGSQGHGAIKPNTTLEFEVELLGIEVSDN